MANGAWEGLAQATGRLPGLALNIAQLQQQGQHMRALEADSARRLALAEETQKIQALDSQSQRDLRDIQIRESKIKADQMQKASELIPFRETLAQMKINRPEEVALFEELTGPYLEKGEASGAPVIQRQHFQTIMSKVPQDPEFGVRFGKTRADAINKEISAIQGQLSNPETAGKIKPEQAQQLQAQLDELVRQRTIADNKVKYYQDQVRAKNKEKYQNVQLTEAREVNGKILPAGTWVATDGAGDVVPLPGTPEKVVEKGMVDQNKNQTREQLTARMLKGDIEAKNILAALDKQESDRLERVMRSREEYWQNRIGMQQDKADRIFASNLRKEFNNLPEIKEYNQTVPKIKSMDSAFKEASKTKNFVAIDQALITLFNKLTDPNSVVRESEYARTAQNIPLLNQIQGKVEKILRGGAGLTSDERASLMKMAKLMYQGYEEIRKRRLGEYRSYGKDAGLKTDFLKDSMAGAVGGDYSKMTNDELLAELNK